MSNSQIASIAGTAIPLLLDDIDTDRIIPARYLRCVTFDGLGEHAFEDDRQQDPDHPFNQERFGNCTALGIPAVSLDRSRLEELAAAIDSDPTAEVTVDIEDGVVRWGTESASVELPESARMALVSGDWDFLSQLLANGESIRETAAKIPYLSGFASE